MTYTSRCACSVIRPPRIESGLVSFTLSLSHRTSDILHRRAPSTGWASHGGRTQPGPPQSSHDHDLDLSPCHTTPSRRGALLTAGTGLHSRADSLVGRRIHASICDHVERDDSHPAQGVCTTRREHAPRRHGCGMSAPSASLTPTASVAGRQTPRRGHVSAATAPSIETAKKPMTR